MVFWLYSADQYAQNTPLAEIAEHAQRHGFNDVPIEVLCLHGYEFVPPAELARLRERNFHLRDVSGIFRTVAARYPNLRARYQNHFFECFLRWIVLKEIYGDEPLLAWDADIFLNEKLSRLHADFAGSTFTCSSTCFVALHDPEWIANYERELVRFEQGLETVLSEIRTALTACHRADPTGFATSFFGPKIAESLGSEDAWIQLFDSTPEEMFVDYLIRLGRLPHRVTARVGDYVFCPQPLLNERLAWVHPFGAGLSGEAPGPWSHDGKSYRMGNRLLAFVHFQGALFRACAVHQLLGPVLGETPEFHDEFYCPPERRTGHSVADVFFGRRVALLARAESRHGAAGLRARWGDLCSERDVARRYLIDGTVIKMLDCHGCRPKMKVDSRIAAVAAFFCGGSVGEINWAGDGSASLRLADQVFVSAPGAGRLSLGDGAVDIVMNLGSLGKVAESEVVVWAEELRRITRRAVWLSIPATEGRDRAWWETRLFAGGLRKHPRQMEAVSYETLEDEGAWLTLVLEPVPAAALVRYPLTALKAERDLHMDMTREPGRRADAHVARYIMARRYLPKAGLVLDAACGLGYGSAVLACTHPEVKVVGLDNSDYAIDYAGTCFKPIYRNLEFQTGDACDLSRFADETVDLVVSFETVEHLREPDKFLAEIRRVLKPGGRFVCSVPNMWVDEEGKDPNPWHFHVFDFAKLAQLCTRFFPLEHVYRQTAGGGMTLHRSPREIQRVNLPVVEGAQDAEWWLVAAAKPRTAAKADRDTVIVLTSDIKHPFFSSWLPLLNRPVEHASHAGLDYEFPPHAALVVAVDCYHEPNVTLLRRAMEQGLPTLILADGVLEYRNTWDHPQLAPGAIFQPVLGHKIACIGRSQARILESWGNAGRCEVIGAPRFDHYATLSRRSRPVAAPARVLVMTAMTPYFTEAQHVQVRQGLLDLKDALAAATTPDGQPVEVVWRVTKGLERELGVDSAVSDFTGRQLAEVLQQVDAVISTPSTAVLEAMLLGLPVAALDYCNVPVYVPTAWRITAASQIAPTLAELFTPSAARLLYQDTALHDALECAAPAAPRLAELVESMIRHAAASDRAIRFPTRLISVEGHDSTSPENGFDLARLYPEQPHFTMHDRRALQVEVGQLRRQLARLEAAGGAPVATDLAERTHRLLTHLPQAQRARGNPDQVAIWEVKVGPASSRVLFLQPPTTLVFTVPTGQRGRLATAIAMHPDVWEQAESGACEFTVRVDGRVAFAMAIDPLKIPDDRRWHEITLDIPASSVGRHQIVLETKGIGSEAYRWAIWRDPRFTWSEAPSLVASTRAGAPASALVS